MTINAELIARTYRNIEANPHGWDQSTFKSCFAARLCKQAGHTPIEVPNGEGGKVRNVYPLRTEDPVDVVRVIGDQSYVWCKERARLVAGITVEQMHRLAYATPTDIDVLHERLVDLFNEHELPDDHSAWLILGGCKA